MDRSDADRRWPRSVYGHGSEPDPRFSFANERTMLAWLRTALGTMVAGISAQVFLDGIDLWLRRLVAVVLVLVGVGCAVNGFLRWRASERSLRRGRPLPGQRFGLVVVVLVSVCGLALLLAAVVDAS